MQQRVDEYRDSKLVRSYTMTVPDPEPVTPAPVTIPGEGGAAWTLAADADGHLLTTEA